jgi:hypothetical protein
VAQQNRPAVTTTTTARLARVKLVRLPDDQTSSRKADNPSLLPDTNQHQLIPPSGLQAHASHETDHYSLVSPTTTPLPAATQPAGKVALWQSPTARAAAGLIEGTENCN